MCGDGDVDAYTNEPKNRPVLKIIRLDAVEIGRLSDVYPGIEEHPCQRKQAPNELNRSDTTHQYMAQP